MGREESSGQVEVADRGWIQGDLSEIFLSMSETRIDRGANKRVRGTALPLECLYWVTSTNALVTEIPG